MTVFASSAVAGFATMHPPTAIIALAVVVAVFLACVLELYPPQTAAAIGAGALLASGALSIDDMLSVFSNPAPLTIAAMFVVSGALTRAGLLDAASRALRRRAGIAPTQTVITLFIGAMALSAFVNNTPVAMVLIPVAIAVAAAIGRTPSQLLIPLSYVTILGGVCTLIGTSTNILVDGVARDAGLEPFGMFEITPIGLPVAIVGGVYLALFAKRLLPATASITAGAARRSGARFVLETLVGAGSPLIGLKLQETALFADNSVRVIDVLRGDESLRRNLRDVVLAKGDRLVIRSDAQDLSELRDLGLLRLSGDALEPVQSRSSTLLEALVGPGSICVGKQLLRLRLRRRYGVYPLAGHRRGDNLAAAFEITPLEVGDTLLLEGAPDDLRRLTDDLGLIALSEPPPRKIRPEKAPIAVAALIAIVALSTLGVASIAAVAVVAVAALLLTRVLDSDEAVESVDGGVLLLIYSMLAIGKALETTGAASIIATMLRPALEHLPIFAALFCVFLATSLMTELVTNNAVAVVVAPIVIELARALALDPRPLMLLIMVAASASFATPIGYQTNTLVYGPGGYRFGDFLRIGAPLNLITGLIATTAVYWLYF